MLINMVRQSGEEGLVLDNALAQKLITSLVQANEKIGEKKQAAWLFHLFQQISSIFGQI